jgi:hypothetical protein
MEMDKEKTVVVFRKFKDQGDIIALFPNEINDSFGNCLTYMHVGQHGSADYQGLMRTETVAATPEEYEPLKRELEGIGYNLDIKKRHRVPKNRIVVGLDLSKVNFNNGSVKE